VGDRAIVIGAGIGGLTAARVLSRRYPSVTVLDRDTLPPDASPRRGVPQGTQPHLLLIGGQRELSALFAGIEEELIAAGGVPIDTGQQLCTFRYGRRWPAAPTGLVPIAVTRPLLEAAIRARVAALPGVVIRDRVAVSGLAGREGVVTGVVLDTGETLDAAVVVDCTGRGSRSDRWLGALGLPSPEQVEVKVGVSYSTRIYRRRPGDLLADGWRAAIILPAPPAERMSGVAMPIEGDRWLVGIGGWHLPDPPSDAATFEAGARHLPDPIVAELIARAEPLGDVVVARFPSSRRRLFEKLGRLPAGYVALGDAICSFNPIYGQGMTCAARQAAALGDALDRRHGTPDAAMAHEYYAAAAEIIQTPWQFAVGGDFSFPETTGPRPRGQAITRWYGRQIAYASQVEPDINQVFAEVQHLIEPASTLFRPRFAARVLRHARKRRRQGAVPG
jgi:2-polyprenyl-6-methoxyphenol hydroxylase-like FAD-dependent oxidoreductase